MFDVQSAIDRDRTPATPAETDRLFRDLVQQHQAKLYGFVLRKIGSAADAEDLTQRAFVQAARSLAAFRGDSALSTWLYGIAMNLVRNHLSRSPERRYRFEDDGAIDSLPSSAAGPERLAEGQELIRELHRELGELPVEMREVLMLVGVEELSYQEAAVLLSIPVGTVRSRVSRARSALRVRLARHGLFATV